MPNVILAILLHIIQINAAFAINTAEDAIISAFDNNYQMQSEMHNYSAQKLIKFEVLTEFLPKIIATHTNNNVKYQDSRVEMINQHPKTRSYDATISQPLFNGWSSVVRLDSSQKLIAAAYLTLKSAANALAVDAIESYERVLAARQKYDFSAENLAVFEKNLEYVKIRFESGVVTLTDVLQSEVRLQNAMAQKEKAFADMKNAEASFHKVTGVPAPKEMSLIDINTSAIPANLEEFIELVLMYNPGLIAKKLDSEIADNDIKVQASQLLPSVSAIGKFNRMDDAYTIKPDANSNTYSLQVSIPIFQGGAEYAGIRKKQYQAKSKSASYNNMQSQLQESAIAIWNGYNTALSILVARKTAISAAEKALDAVKEEIAFGTRTTIDLLNAQKELFDAKVMHRDAQMDIVTTYFKILQIIGRIEIIDALMGDI